MESKYVGKFVTVIDRNSIYCGEWGIIKAVDDDCFYVAIANDESSMPVFSRDQIKVRRNRK